MLKRIFKSLGRRNKRLFYTLKKMIFSFIPRGNVIIFESIPDLSDNTKAVFDEMVKRGFNQKYKMIWRVNNDPSQYSKIDNVLYLNVVKDSKQLLYYYRRAKLFIICNEFIYKQRFGQKIFYLSHGTAMKSVRGYYIVPNWVDRLLLASENVAELQAYELRYDINKTIALGFPRNDQLAGAKHNLHSLFKVNFNKIIVWYPTFRQHNGGVSTGSNISLPIIHNVEQAICLNDLAMKENVLLVIKPHFAQDVSKIRDLGLSNIIIIHDDFFKNNNISSYEFVASCDAMLSDYSSIYYDYLLCDKPIGLVWEDIEEYKNNPGLVDEYEYYASGAYKIYTYDDMKTFILDVVKGNDPLKSERRSMRDITNYSTDGKNSERVADYIIDEFKL